jgi:asparagine synthase (glutamine-hydrolysing)
VPGIVGIITRIRREVAEAELRCMLETMRHEPFYETGTWIDESLGLYLGWVTRKDARPGTNPIYNQQRDKVLVFSGEEYTEPTVPAWQPPNGHRTNSNRGSYLIDLAERDGNFPASLNGRFQGILCDKTAGRAILFNDRYGMHRVYYHESEEAFYFAAEAKSILSVRPELRSIDLRALGELISCGCTLENKTIFTKIGVLPPASAWIFRGGTLEKKAAYFDPKEWESQETLDPETYYSRLREAFSRVLPRYFGGSGPVGVSLTGGLDSRMIMAWLNAPSETVSCFSFGGPYRDCQDVALARQVARLCGQRHQTIPVGEDFLRQFARYAERTIYLSDGCVNMTHTVDLYVNERAREIAPVRMTGNYGGEVLRSIRAFKPVEPSAGLFLPELSTHIHHAKQTYQSLLSVHPLSFSVFRQAPWHHYGLQALEQTQLALRSPFLDNEVVKTVFQAPQSTYSNSDVSLRLIADGNSALLQIPTDRGLAGGSGKLLSTLRHQYLEFTFKAEYAYDYGMPQWVARADHALSSLHLERLFLGRHKFYHFRVWYRDSLSNYVQQILLDPMTLSRPYLNRQVVEATVRGHVKGDRNHTTEIHKLLSLELLHRLFIDAS